MAIAIVPPITSAIRAFSGANPSLEPNALAKRLRLMISGVRHAPETAKPRINSSAVDLRPGTTTGMSPTKTGPSCGSIPPLHSACHHVWLPGM